VAYALAHKTRYLRSLDDLERKVVAKAVVEYLQLSNWKFERGPPAEGAAQLYTGAPK
jgi:hypothetical protein